MNGERLCCKRYGLTYNSRNLRNRRRRSTAAALTVMTQKNYIYEPNERTAPDQAQLSVAAPYPSSLGAFYLKNLLKFLLLLFILAVAIYAPRMVFGSTNT